MVKQILNARWRYLCLIIILLIAGYLFNRFVFDRISIFRTRNYSPLYSTAAYSLSGNARITQEFEARYPGLHRVDVYFRKGSDDSDGQVIFHLKNSCQVKEDQEAIVVSYSSIIDGELHPFIFTPIDESAGRKFCIVLETRSLERPAHLEVYASRMDVYSTGAASYEKDTTILVDKDKPKFVPTHFIWLPIVHKAEDSTELEFDIGFILYYNGSTPETVKALLTHLSNNKPYWFGNSEFYVLLFVIYFIALLLLWLLAFRIKSGPKL